MWRNDTKCKYMFMFPLKKLSHKELIIPNAPPLHISCFINWFFGEFITRTHGMGNNLLPWASCQIRKIVGCTWAGNDGNVFPTTAGQRSGHASRHMCDARAVMHTGIANCDFLLSWWRENVPSVPGACATRYFAYLVKGLCCQYILSILSDTGWK